MYSVPNTCILWVPLYDGNARPRTQNNAHIKVFVVFELGISVKFIQFLYIVIFIRFSA